jgi:RNA polymerase sigma factor (sigma-70 family)
MVRGIAEGAITQEFTTAFGATDEELLARFLDMDGVASEDAFHMLVGRHGPRVLRICRHVLDREHDAEDAFQATFLALARNGASIRDRCALAGWLQEVAYRTALKTRARRSRRRMVERESMVMHAPRDEPDDQGERAALAELRPVLHEEVTGLPDKYRLPVVLSYLEGKTNEEVAALLKWPVGTVKGRLSRGRALLRSRLTRRGVALSAGSLLWALSGSRSEAAEVPADLLGRTVRQALESRISPHASHSSSSPSEPSAGDIPSGDPAPSATSDEVSPSPPPKKNPKRSRADQLVAAAILLLAFSASIFVGGFVSATAYGGRFPDIRAALAGLRPSLWKPGPAACHPAALEPPPGTDQRLNRTSTPPNGGAGAQPRWEGR